MNEIRKETSEDNWREGKVTSAENRVGRIKYYLNAKRQGRGIKETLARIDKELDSLLKSLDKYEGMDLASEEAEERIPADVMKDAGRLTGIEMVVRQLHKKIKSGEEIKGIVK